MPVTHFWQPVYIKTRNEIERETSNIRKLSLVTNKKKSRAIEQPSNFAVPGLSMYIRTRLKQNKLQITKQASKRSSYPSQVAFGDEFVEFITHITVKSHDGIWSPVGGIVNESNPFFPPKKRPTNLSYWSRGICCLDIYQYIGSWRLILAMAVCCIVFNDTFASWKRESKTNTLCWREWCCFHSTRFQRSHPQALKCVTNTDPSQSVDKKKKKTAMQIFVAIFCFWFVRFKRTPLNGKVSARTETTRVSTNDLHWAEHELRIGHDWRVLFDTVDNERRDENAGSHLNWSQS